jgi:hypothetical protein
MWSGWSFHVRGCFSRVIIVGRPRPRLTLYFYLLDVVDRIIVRPAAVEFLVHMALAAGASSVNSLAEDGLVDREPRTREDQMSDGAPAMSRSEHVGKQGSDIAIRHQRVERFSITGAQLDLQWRRQQLDPHFCL